MARQPVSDANNGRSRGREGGADAGGRRGRRLDRVHFRPTRRRHGAVHGSQPARSCGVILAKSSCGFSVTVVPCFAHIAPSFAWMPLFAGGCTLSRVSIAGGDGTTYRP